MAFSKYRPDIDGLRAIAVLAVVLYHASISGFQGGFVGVDVFFVISGFLITNLLYRELETSNTINFLDFYARRFKRLYPAMLTTVVVCIIIWVFFFLGSVQDTKQFYRSARFAVFGFANVFFHDHTGGYFDISAEENPLLHFWSLGVEEQFYLVWPLFLHFSNFSIFKFKNLKFRVTLSLLVISISAFFYTLYLLKDGKVNSAFYLMPARAWELGLGGILGIYSVEVRDQVSRLPSIVVNALGTLGLLLISYSIYFFDQNTIFPGVTAIIPILGTIILISIGTHPKSKISSWLSLKTIVYLGTLSYGWYLWHWPLLSFLRIHHLGEPAPLHERLLAIILSLALAELSLRFIERPVRLGQKFNLIKPKPIIISFLTVSILVSLMGTGLGIIERVFENSNNGENFQHLIAERTSMPEDCLPKSNGQNINCELRNESNSKKQIVLWGDSHAHSYLPMLEQISKKGKLSVRLATAKSLIPLVGMETVYRNGFGKNINFGKANKDILGWINRKDIKTSVILASRWQVYTGVKPISVADVPIYLEPMLSTEKTLKFYRQSLDETLSTIVNLGVSKILIVLPFPEYKYEIKRCLKDNGCPITLKKFEAYRKETLELLTSIASKYKEVRLIDPTKYFCDDKICPQIGSHNGTRYPLVYDDDHPSVYSARLFGEYISKDLEWLVE